jgi:hypothetical protein
VQSFSHPFFDIEIEPAESGGEKWLVKILSIDGRRFTYALQGPVDQLAVDYMRSLMDAAVFGDLVIERTGDALEARESPTSLKKHS